MLGSLAAVPGQVARDNGPVGVCRVLQGGTCITYRSPDVIGSDVHARRLVPAEHLPAVAGLGSCSGPDQPGQRTHLRDTQDVEDMRP